MNRALLRAKMVERGDTTADLAKVCGVATVTFKRSLYVSASKRRPFTEYEIDAIRKRYRLTPKELCDIFFSES